VYASRIQAGEPAGIMPYLFSCFSSAGEAVSEYTFFRERRPKVPGTPYLKFRGHHT